MVVLEDKDCSRTAENSESRLHIPNWVDLRRWGDAREEDRG